MDTPRNLFNSKNLPYPSQDRSWWQKPRHTLLGRALEAFQTGQSTRGCAALRRLTPTKHTAGPLATIMKTILTVLLLGFVINSQGQILDSNYYWIAVNSTPIKKNEGIWPIDGMIIKFDNGQLVMNHIFHDSIISFPFETRKSEIYIDNTLWAIINHINKDSLVLDFNKSMRVKFIPISKGNLNYLDLNYWNYYDWRFIYNGSIQEFKLLDSLWNRHLNEIAKICVTHFMGERYRYSSKEKWIIQEVNYRHIFAKTIGQFNYEFYNVVDYKGDTVLLESLSFKDSSEVLLYKVPHVSVSEKEKIISTIQNLRWHSTYLVDKSNSFEEDTIVWKYESTGYLFADTTLLKKTSLIKNQLSFEFLDNYIYKIYESDTLRISGKWKLSETGKQIVLNHGYVPNDYIDLFKIDADSIFIGKSDLFQVGERKNDYVDYYYKMILKK